MSTKEEEVAKRVIVWKNLRIIVKNPPVTEPPKVNEALLVLVNAEQRAHE
jgi:hypothetical protein